MLRDARKVDGLISLDPLVGLYWKPTPSPPPRPFSAEERTKILEWFRVQRFSFHGGRAKEGPRIREHPPFYAMTHLLFWTGMRPSEATALRIGDVDLSQGILRVWRSRVEGSEEATKVDAAARTVEMIPQTIEILRGMNLTERPRDAYLFTNTEGNPIDVRKFEEHFQRCLSELRIDHRGPYTMKDTFITEAFTGGLDPEWIIGQTGVSYRTLKKHYGSYLRAARPDQIAKLAELATGMAPQRLGRRQSAHREGGKKWTRSQPIRTVAQIALRVSLVQTTTFSYQLIADRAEALRRLGLSDSSIARSLGVTDKTVAKAIRWRDSVHTGSRS